MFAGSPTTFVQLSPTAGSHFDLDYYCAKLIDAGNEVLYTKYDKFGPDLLTRFEFVVFESCAALTHHA